MRQIQKLGYRILPTIAAAATFALVSSGCNSQGSPTTTPEPSNQNADECAPRTLPVIATDTGAAQVFMPDPIASSKNASLMPSSSALDSFGTPVQLKNLDKRGVLSGKYVDIRNGLNCKDLYGAYDKGNNFVYPHGNFRFQEAMTYYFGDTYRAKLDTLGVLAPTGSVKIVSHCMLDDNAFFAKQAIGGGQYEGIVCLGDSTATPGASYSDDGVVVLHELQHATTLDSYVLPNSKNISLNQFWYDEAGALNEAVSDFTSLIHTAPLLDAALDPRVFSRWALGTFIPNRSGIRGANKCPVYSSGYPDCPGYPSFSADTNTVSYVYPDGMGWPYANNFTGPGFANSAFTSYRGQEEIHNAAVLLSGALWDMYEAIKAARGGDATSAENVSLQLVMNALRTLPQPTPSNLSPVTYRGFAAELVSTATSLGLPAADITAITQALTARGLIGGTPLPSSWAAVGSGRPATPGLRVEDNPILLSNWLRQMGGDPRIVKQDVTTGSNSKADPGEVVAVWFDLKNTAAQSAGGILLTINSPDPDVELVGLQANIGTVSATQAQIFYSKVYGTTTSAALTSSNPALNVPTGNTYFLTNPFYAKDYTTAVWIRISPTAQKGKTVNLSVTARPSNGETSTAEFPLVIN